MDDNINLSRLTETLIKQISSVKKKPEVDDLSKISVSGTVSFFALVYEKIRNAVEYREEHLIRRAAIERILKRRLMLNPTGSDEAENVIRELLWARYFPADSLSTYDVDKIQVIIDKYLLLRRLSITGRPEKIQIYISQFILQLLTCEIEETLSPYEASKNTLYTFYIFQVLCKKIKVENINSELQDAYFYIAVEKGFAKNDTPYLRSHLFQLFSKPIGQHTTDEIKKIVPKLVTTIKKIDDIINNPYSEKLVKFVKRQTPPFLILFAIVDRNIKNIRKILINKEDLWAGVEIICREKYQLIAKRLRTTAVRSLIYIFLTKMIFAFILEYPLSLYLFQEVHMLSIGVNTLFPPILMLILVSLVSVPGEENTRKIYKRIIDIVNKDISFETSIAWISKKPRIKKPLMIFGFTVFYGLTFVITISLIYKLLSFFNFNFISQVIFIFFVSLVAFFGFRVRQIAKEYHLSDKESFFAPFVYFFFMPILSLGKFLSSEISKLNFFILFFDFLIEAPFKLIFGVVEEWISFLKARKDELV